MYAIGDRIVYPMHGAGVVEAIEEREVIGKNRYITLYPHSAVRSNIWKMPKIFIFTVSELPPELQAIFNTGWSKSDGLRFSLQMLLI